MDWDDAYETIQDYVYARTQALRGASDSELAGLPDQHEERMVFHGTPIVLCTRNVLKRDGRRGIVVDACVENPSSAFVQGWLEVDGFVITPDGHRTELATWEWGY